jgi:fructan beta-fructosidase
MKKVLRRLLPLWLAVWIFMMGAVPAAAADVNYNYYDETFRPQYHYTPPANWMNDPNGMVYYQGEYHLFYQYYPEGEVWGPMHWGHAVSTDMTRWTTLPIALYPDNQGYIFSGSAVIDWNNTAGFGAEAMVAIFTYSTTTGVQSQGIAYSTDKGRSWTKYSGNPVIPNPGLQDFRDPKVFWHASTNKWVMVTAAGDRIKIHTSPDLKNWTHASDFGMGLALGNGVWECPDLFPLAVNGNPADTKWVMILSLGNGAVAGGSGMQYFVGDFDGTKFTNLYTPEWADFGPDFYAAVSFSDIPSTDGRRIWVGWMNNWNYATKIPATTWRSAMSVPRELKLTTFAGDNRPRLQQVPAAELQSLRGTAKSWGTTSIAPGSNLLSATTGDSFEVVAEFQAGTTTASEFGFKVRKGGSQYTTVGYNKTNQKLFIDRSYSGETGFHPSFAWKHEAPMGIDAAGKVKMRFFVDRQMVELLGNDGRASISDLIFPDRGSVGMELYTIGGNVTLNSLNIYPMNRSWGATPFTSNLSGWKNVNGKWADTLGVKQGRGTGDAFTMAGSHISADFTYQADIKVLDYAGKGAGALVFRSDIQATKGYAANIDAANDLVKLFRLNGDGTSTVVAQHSTPIHSSTNYILKVSASGSNIKIYLNNTLVLDVNDSSYESGYFGLNAWNATAEFKEVHVTGLSGLKSNVPAMMPKNGTWSNTAAGKQGTATGDAFTLSAQSSAYVNYSADIRLTSGGAGALVFRSDAAASNAYVANVDVTNKVVKLFKLVNGAAAVLGQYPAALANNTTYNLRVVADGTNIKVFLNGTERINVTDASHGSGRLGLNVWNGTAAFQNILYTEGLRELNNHDFELGNMSYWTSVSGNAFSPEDLSNASAFWGGPYNNSGTWHFDSYKYGGDNLIGVMKSEDFILGGNGQIDLLVAGGKFSSNMYIALTQAGGEELIRLSPADRDVEWDGYDRMEIDAHAFVGRNCYIKIVDNATGGWAHINIDDVNVPVRK